MLLIKQGIGNWNGMGTKPNFNPRNNRGRRAIFVGPWVVTGTFRFSTPAVPLALCLTSRSNGGSVSTRSLCLRNYVAIGSSSTFCNKICICLCVYRPKANLFCIVISFNQRSVLTQPAATWFLDWLSYSLLVSGSGERTSPKTKKFLARALRSRKKIWARLWTRLPDFLQERSERRL